MANLNVTLPTTNDFTFGQHLELPRHSHGGSTTNGGGGGRRGLRRKKAPSYRHGTPSGPWPFLDIDDEVDPKRIDDPDNHLPMSAEACQHRKQGNFDFCWCKYPQALYPNWTRRQQKKSKISRVINRKTEVETRVFYVDVGKDAIFSAANDPNPKILNNTLSRLDDQWKLMNDERPTETRARVVFLDGLNGPALQMFGMRYNIEPFFFSSTIGGIPSRFQSNKTSDQDHITITLSFIRSQARDATETVIRSANSSAVSLLSVFSTRSKKPPPPPPKPKVELKIDTQAPLELNRGEKSLVLTYDFLSVHLIRRKSESTLISCHSNEEDLTTNAETMFQRFMLAGQSVYWSHILKDTKDPTFLLLCILWYVMYAWDEVFDALYEHICYLEGKVITSNDLEFTEELHVIRAHLLHYESLLDEFKKTIEFVSRTDSPTLDSCTPEEKKGTKALITRECDNLLHGITRLERNRMMQDKRLKNVMDLSFNMINIEDSKRMAKLTEAAVRDSAAMKQIAYLTMFFLPAGFVATCFGMNIVEINPSEAKENMTLAKYFAVAIPLTAVTVWLVIAYQIQLEDTRPRDEVASAPSSQPAVPSTDGTPAPPAATPGANAGAGSALNAPYMRWTLDPKPNSPRKQMSFAIRLLWPLWLFISIFQRKKMVQTNLIKSAMKKPIPFNMASA